LNEEFLHLSPGKEQALLDHLLQFVTEEKAARMRAVLRERTEWVRVVLEDIFQPHNASASVRSCECFGIQHVHVVENRYTYTLNREVAMGSSRWVDLHRHRNPENDNSAACLEELREAGYRVVATSLSNDAVPLSAIPLDRPLALCFGTEEDGLGEGLLASADLHTRIPMYGFTQSYNLSVSVALCLQEIRRRLEAEGIDFRLGVDRQRSVQLGWLLRCLRNGELLARAFLRETFPEQGPPA
jgi:tRNA (guanosine-2'-O-)-methyltransferase